MNHLTQAFVKGYDPILIYKPYGCHLCYDTFVSDDSKNVPQSLRSCPKVTQQNFLKLLLVN